MKKLKWLFITFIIALLIAGIGIGIMMLPPEVRRISKRTIDGYDVRDYERADLETLLNSKYQWNVIIKGSEGEEALDNAIEPVIVSTLDQAYEMRRGFQYEIALTEEDIASIVDSAVTKFTSEDGASEMAGGITYDEATDQFILSDSVIVYVADTEKLAADLKQALESKNYNTTIQVEYKEDPASTEPVHYEMIGSFETTAKNNSNRNTNISNACEMVNGTILQPGEQFSYNETLGERTAAKGYKEAGAYLNGEHVNQIGGGICQLSSTLYNAIFAANVQVDYRTNHTFEPSYVRPGLDATVSYPQPDLLFTNDTGYPLGISAHFVNQQVTVEIYGVRTLEEGVVRYMTSEKVSALPAPANTYQDNVTLQPNQEVLVQAPKAGSKWVTYEVLEKDGEIISQTELYYSKYKGEGGIVQRNLTFDSMVANIQQQQASQAAQ